VAIKIALYNPTFFTEHREHTRLEITVAHSAGGVIRYGIQLFIFLASPHGHGSENAHSLEYVGSHLMLLHILYRSQSLPEMFPVIDQQGYGQFKRRMNAMEMVEERGSGA